MKHKILIFAVLLLSPNVYAKAGSGGGGANVNFRYHLDGKGILDFNLGSMFNLGLVGSSVSASGETTSGSTVQKATATGTSVGARLTFCLQGQGMGDGFYLAGEGGSLKLDLKRTQNGAADFKGSSNGTYAGAFLGYHWFWSVFNLNLGYGSAAWNVDPISITDGSTTETYSNLPTRTTGFEFGLGLAF